MGVTASWKWRRLAATGEQIRVGRYCHGMVLRAVRGGPGIGDPPAHGHRGGYLDIAPSRLARAKLKILDLDTDAGEEQLQTLIKLTERYCVIYQTLNNPPPLEVSRQVTGA